MSQRDHGSRSCPSRLVAIAVAGAAVLLSAACAASTTAAAPADPGTTQTSGPTAPEATGSPTPVGSLSASAAKVGSPLPLPTGYDPAADARAEIRSALAASVKDHREVLLDFGANWCPDCRVLDALFADSQVDPLLQQHYRVVSVDVGNWDHNLDLAASFQLDLRTSGIPALVVLGADGKVRHVTNDGAFSNARTMDPGQVAAFLTQWSGASGR